MLGSCWVAAQLAASQEGLSSMSEWEWVSISQAVSLRHLTAKFQVRCQGIPCVIFDGESSTGSGSSKYFCLPLLIISPTMLHSLNLSSGTGTIGCITMSPSKVSRFLALFQERNFSLKMSSNFLPALFSNNYTSIIRIYFDVDSLQILSQKPVIRLLFFFV
jgi:hypothetical protein